MVSETATKQDKQITVDVPEERVAEFYAFYARFLAGRRGRRRRGGHGRGCHGHRRTEQREERMSGDVQEA